MTPTRPVTTDFVDVRPRRSEIAGVLGDSRPVTFVGCDLEAIDLAEIDLTGARFDRCTLHHADFRNSILERSVWTGCRGRMIAFVAADLSDSTITRCDFNNADFRRATLASVDVHASKLTGADLTGASTLDLTIDETLLIDAKLPRVSFRGRRLTRVDMTRADLRRCDFRSAVFNHSSLREAALEGAMFADADLRGADLGGLRVGDAAAYRGATISIEQAGQLMRELGLRLA